MFRAIFRHRSNNNNTIRFRGNKLHEQSLTIRPWQGLVLFSIGAALNANQASTIPKKLGYQYFKCTNYVNVRMVSNHHKKQKTIRKEPVICLDEILKY